MNCERGTARRSETPGQAQGGRVRIFSAGWVRSTLRVRSVRQILGGFDEILRAAKIAPIDPIDRKAGNLFAA
jgi:hypothetical protein